MNDVDLSALRMQPSELPLPKPPLGPRLANLALVSLALTVGATFAWPLLRPVRGVPMAAVRATTSDGPAAQTLAEAAGWIEPDPFPIWVRPLVGGRIEAIDVVEGAAVVGGATVLARLRSASLDAALERARASLHERETERAAAAARLDAARAALEQRADLRAAANEARQLAADAAARLAVADGAQERLRADAAGAAALLQAQRRLADAGASYPVALARAQASVDGTQAAFAAATRELAARELEATAANARRDLADELLATPTALQAAVTAAAADLQRADAVLATARGEVDIAARELAWTEVKAPCDGVVFKLHQAPGGIAGPDTEPILALYDPLHMRARIDVPLAAVAAIQEGQAVELRSEVLGGKVVAGVVQRVQRESDLLKNTLQVKVRVVDPPPLLRPETLCRARFVGSAPRDGTPASAHFVVPRAAVQNGLVFRFDPAARCARAVAVRVVEERGDEVVVEGDLSVAQRVVLVPVADGDAVREDTAP